MVAGGARLLAWTMADAGTPLRRAMASMVSPGPTVIALPPSQLQFADAGAGLRTTEPLATGAPGPVAASLVAGLIGCACPDWGASGRLSTRPTGAACACGTPCATEPVVSGWLRAANGFSLKRDVSLLHAATPMLISASAAARGQHRERTISRTRDIATHSHAIHSAS